MQAVAAELRATLLAAAAARRGGGPAGGADAEMSRLLRVVDAFPMGADAPEAALVGSALRDKFTTAEMEALLKGLVRAATLLALLPCGASLHALYCASSASGMANHRLPCSHYVSCRAEASLLRREYLIASKGAQLLVPGPAPSN